MGWPRGIEVDVSTGTWTALNIEDSTLRLRNITVAGCGTNTRFSLPGTPPPTIPTNTVKDDASFLDWMTKPFYGNDFLTNASEANLIQPFNYSAPDPTPFGSGGSAAAIRIRTGGGFTDTKFTGDTFFDKTVTFRGGVAPAGELASWWKGWTKFNYNK